MVSPLSGMGGPYAYYEGKKFFWVNVWDIVLHGAPLTRSC